MPEWVQAAYSSAYLGGVGSWRHLHVRLLHTLTDKSDERRRGMYAQNAMTQGGFSAWTVALGAALAATSYAQAGA